MKSKAISNGVLKKAAAALMATCLTFGNFSGFATFFGTDVGDTIEQAIGIEEVMANDDMIGTDTLTALGIAGHWSADYMQNLYDRGLLSGDESGNLNPSNDITKAEFVAILNRAFGYTDLGTMSKSSFSDITGEEWYARDIMIAQQEGYLYGNGKESGASSPLSREEAIVLLARNLQLTDTYVFEDNFMDSKDIGTWSIGAVNTAVSKGFIAGYDDGTFRPQNNVTRGEVSRIMSNVVGELVDSPTDRSLSFVEGNVTISSSNVILRDTVIMGDLYVTGGVGYGHIALDNVVVLGEIIISGTGKSHDGNSSVRFTDCTANKLTVAGGYDDFKTLLADGTTSFEEVFIVGNAYLEETSFYNGGFKNITFNSTIPGAELILSGSFDNVRMLGVDNHLYLESGSIDTVYVDERAFDSTINIGGGTYIGQVYLDVGIHITGKGDLLYVKVNGEGAVIDMLPESIEVRAGLTASVNGNKNVDTEEANALSSGPRLVEGYPNVDNIMAKTADALVKTNKPGTLYWALNLHTDGVPATSELLKPDPYSSTFLMSGSITMETEIEKTIALKSLEKATDYTFSAVFVDEHETRSAVRYDSFTTVDDTSTAFASGFPTMTDIGDTWANFDLILTREAQIFWAVYTPDMPAPTESDLRNGNLTYSVVNNKSTSYVSVPKLSRESFEIEGLEEITDYVLYLVAADGNNTSGLKSIKFSTIDLTDPWIIETSIDTTNSKSTDVIVNVNETAAVYYAVYAASETFPTTLVDGLTVPDYEDDEAKQQVIVASKSTQSGKTKTVEALYDNSFTLSKITLTNDYNVYVVAEDVYGNLSPVERIYVPARPEFVDSYPQAEIMDNSTENLTNVRLTFNTTKAADVYWVIYEGSKVTTPTVGELLAIESGSLPQAITWGVTTVTQAYVPMSPDIVMGLKELTDYTLFAVVSDVAGTQNSSTSSVYSLKFSTVDETAPSFVYVVQSTKSSDGMEFLVRLDEDCTLYWSAVEKDEIFFTSDPNYSGVSSHPFYDQWDREFLQNQVISGANATAGSGKLTMKAGVDNTVKLTKLQEATWYDVYFTAVDKYGNRTKITTGESSSYQTTDETPPYAWLEYSDVDLFERPRVNADITLVFSEIVRDARILGGMTDDELPYTIYNTDIHNYIEVWDVTSSPVSQLTIQGNGTLVEINQYELNVVDGKIVSTTEVTLKNGALADNDEFAGLINGRTYRMDLSNFADISGNEMELEDRSLTFEIASPVITFIPEIESQTMDFAFQEIPDEFEIGDYHFDTIVTVKNNKKIQFVLYEKKSDGTWNPVAVSDSQQLQNVDIVTSFASMYQLAQSSSGYFDPANESTPDSLKYTLPDGQVAYYKTSELTGVKENYSSRSSDGSTGITAIEYGLKLTSIDGETDRDVWTDTIEVQFDIVMGYQNVIIGLAENPTQKLQTYIDNGSLKYIGSYEYLGEMLSYLPMERTFSDNAAPIVYRAPFRAYSGNDPDTGKAEYDIETKDEDPYYGPIYDNYATIEMIVNKPSTLYYIIAPEGTFTQAPTAEQMAGGAVSLPATGVSGIEELPGNTLFSFDVEGLSEPSAHYIVNDGGTGKYQYDESMSIYLDADIEDNYVLYYTLASASGKMTEVYVDTFSTFPTRPPELTFQAIGNETEITVSVFTNKPATVDWVVYNSSNVPANKFGYTEPDEEHIDGVTESHIRPAANQEYEDVIARGTTVTDWIDANDASKGAISTIRLSATTEGLDMNALYNIYGIAYNPPSDNDSDITKMSGLALSDTTAPGILKVTNLAIVKNTAEEGEPDTYKGYVTILFTEPLYYDDQSSGTSETVTTPMTARKLQLGLAGFGADGNEAGYDLMGNATSDPVDGKERKGILYPYQDDVSSPIDTITFYYDAAFADSTYIYSMNNGAPIRDAVGNTIKENLWFTFYVVDYEGGTFKAAWYAGFGSIPDNPSLASIDFMSITDEERAVAVASLTEEELDSIILIGDVIQEEDGDMPALVETFNLITQEVSVQAIAVEGPEVEIEVVEPELEFSVVEPEPEPEEEEEEPPVVVVGPTQAKVQPQVASVTSGKPTVGSTTYSGTLSVKFTEPLFFKTEDGDVISFNKVNFENNLDRIDGNGNISLQSFSNSGGGVTMLSFKYTGAIDGTTYAYNVEDNYMICNADGEEVDGDFELEFKESYGNKENSSWSGGFGSVRVQ